MQLRERDLRAALDFVGEAYDCEDLPEFRSVLLPGYRRLVPFDYSSYNEIANGTEVLAALTEPEMPAWAVAKWEIHANENPLLRHFLRTRDGRPTRFSDVISKEELEAMPVYQEFYRPLGLGHQVAFLLPSTSALTVAMVLNRGGTDFDERDRKLLELTRPHLIQAYRAAALRERLHGTIADLRSGLDADGIAIVVVAEDDTVRFASAPARSLLEGTSMQPPVEEGRPLPGPLADWMARGESSGRISLPGEDRTLLAKRLHSGGRTVLTLADPRRTLSPEALGTLGLTPREAAVLSGLAAGKRSADLAAELGIRPRTVAKHMQSVHAKLGVTDRAQAVATAWAATPDGSVPTRARIS